jgi:hypothetical protein
MSRFAIEWIDRGSRCCLGLARSDPLTALVIADRSVRLAGSLSQNSMNISSTILEDLSMQNEIAPERDSPSNSLRKMLLSS